MTTKTQAKVMQILPELNAGGVERGTIEIARALNDNGYESLVCSAGGILTSELKKCNTKHIQFPAGCKNPFKFGKLAKKLREIIISEKIDIIHARSRASAWIAYIACKGTNCKFITTFHGVYSGKSALKRKYNSIMTKGEIVIAVSQFIKDHIITNYKIDPSKIEVIHRGVDLDYFNEKNITSTRLIKYCEEWKIPEDKKVILMPGRISSWKGQELLIDALASLEHRDYYCLIVGASGKHKNFLNRIEQKIRDFDLEHHIAIHNNTRDILSLYKLADLVISPSLRPEAFGRTIVEAGAMGVPVIATKHGGATETIIHGKTGIFIEEFTAEALAEAINKALQLPPENIEKISKITKEHVSKNFSINLMQEKTLNIYQRLLEQND